MLVETTYSSKAACVLDCGGHDAAFGLPCSGCNALPPLEKGRNCETNPISFKTYYPPNTNNEKNSLLTKSKSYDYKTMLQVVAPLLLKMLHLKSIKINDVADVAPFPTSYTNYATHPLPRRSPRRDKGASRLLKPK